MNARDAHALAVKAKGEIRAARENVAERAARRARRSWWYQRVTLPWALWQIRAAASDGHDRTTVNYPRALPGAFGRREALFRDLRERGYTVEAPDYGDTWRIHWSFK